MKRAGALVLFFVSAGAACHAATLDVTCPPAATVFDLCELRVQLPEAFARMPDTQIHDAYDADRDGAHVQLIASFRHADGETMTVPGFAMRERFGGPWEWRVRWSPRRPGKWTVMLSLKGKPAADAKPVLLVQNVKTAITASVVKGVDGPLVAPKGKQPPGYLRRLRPDGSSEALWLFGACRAWVVDRQDKHNDWFPHEWLDRETELLAPMREGGFNLLNQWMAPWEFLLVHHDRAERWKQKDGGFKRRLLPGGSAWSPYQCYDQGRAAAFDALVRLCEGGPKKPTVHLLLSPLPHQCVQVREHPWGSQESGWSPENDAGKQTLERLNGFSGFRKKMSVWAFFEADPARPLDDWRSQLFDHQANFFRYVIARWGYSQAVGVWVLVDELDAVGDVVGVMSKKKGWWGHPQCGVWLANTVRMFRGKLERSDGMVYAGDPFGHPLHAATTSFGGQAGRGGNIDWPGGPADARPDLFGWHWYPSWTRDMATWASIWDYAVRGVASYARAPIGPAPRLISEFGAPDRNRPTDEPSNVYPTLYHHAIWAAIFSGQAGTPMDWDDGKEFGELRWRNRKGLFGEKSYPIDHVAQLKALRKFLGGLKPSGLVPCAEKGTPVTCDVPESALVLALCRKSADAVFGWLCTFGEEAEFKLVGLRPGTYALTWVDPWTGDPAANGRKLIVGKEGTAALDPVPVLRKLRAAAKPFPRASRMHRGNDVAFQLVLSSTN